MNKMSPTTTRLALFDLDHTLISGDSDVLWCTYLIERGWVAPERAAENAELGMGYQAGTVSPQAFCGFYASLHRGRSADELMPLRHDFLERVIVPLIPDDARALLQRHRAAGDTLVLTTATNRVASGLTAAHLGFEHYLCTELEQADGVYTGRCEGILNIRTGKPERLRQWLASQGRDATALRGATFYSDSINDLPLLSAVGRPVVVDPDPRLESTALRKGWAVLRFNRPRSR